MPNYICVACGAEYAESPSEPPACLICSDERQFVGWNGQKWTTMEALRRQGYRVEIQQEEPNLISIGMNPTFAIGQRALLVLTPHGNVLYDCLPYIDSETVHWINELGGIKVLALSHPHFYDSMVSWSHAFDRAPIFIPKVDQEWVMRPDPVIHFWSGLPEELVPGVTLIQCGGHFPGSSVLHWEDGAGGQGALLVGDSIIVGMDRGQVSFMHSYPNFLPLSAEFVQGIVDAVAPYPFDRIYGGWWDRNVSSNAKQILEDSAKRYQQLLLPKSQGS